MEHGAQNWLDEVISTLPHALTPDTPLRMASEGNALADLFNAVQLWASGAQLSATSLANDVAGLPKTVRRRDLLIAYPYTNTLAVLEITGKDSQSGARARAEYFSRGEDGRLCVSDVFLRPKVEHYNYDYYAGVSYVYDISRPVGERVTSMRVTGRTCAKRTPLPSASTATAPAARAGTTFMSAACRARDRHGDGGSDLGLFQRI